MKVLLKRLIFIIGAILLSSSLAIAAAPVINPSLPGGMIGLPYDGSLFATGGSAPLVWSLAAGTLPAGLSLSAISSQGKITGIPTALGTSNFTVRVTDSVGATTTKALSIVVGTPIVINRTLPGAAVGSPYFYAVSASGGTPPYSWSADWNFHPGNLYAEFTLNSLSGVISGTPLHINYTDSFVLRVTDSVGATTSTVTSIRIEPEVFITTTSLPPGSVGRAYLESVTATGGTTPFEFSLIAGTIPLGLSLNPSTGLISGMPTTLGTSNFTVRVSDRFGAAKTKTLSIPIGPPLITTTITTLPGGAVGSAYWQTVAATGGTPPYAWSIVYLGTLPAGLTLNPSTGVISGTPINANVQSFFSLRVTDSLGVLDTNEFSITIAAAVAITTSSLPTGTVATTYAQTVAVTGGTVPRSFSVTSGILPPGLAVNTSTGAITGAPTAAGTFSFTVQVADGDGVKAAQALAITITPKLIITTTFLQDGTTNAPYSRTMLATGGTLPFIWSLMAGSLPAGVSLNAGTGEINGMPTAAFSSFIIVQVADSLGATFSQPYLITITSGPTITTTTLTGGTVSAVYARTLAASGGTAPLVWSLTAGTLPAGLSLNAATGAITGIPTTADTSGFTVRVTDAVGGGTDKALTISIASVLTITTTTLPGGTVGTAYTRPVTSAGGTAPLTWSLSAGTLPAGLTLNISTGAITGTPTTAAVSNFTIQAADSAGATASQAFSVTIAAAMTITASLPGGTLGTAYVQTVTVTGGTAPLAWAVTVGTLPAGLSLNSSTGAITGTPSAVGTSNFTIQVSDAAEANTSKVFALPIASILTITTASFPGGTLGTAYSQTLGVAGGTAPYTWSLTAGTVPTGLTLNADTGAITGTPTTAGTSGFTVRVLDAAGATAPKGLFITIASALSITTTALPDGSTGQAYATTLVQSGGTAPFVWSVTDGTLPAGLTLNSGTGVIAGTLSVAGSSAFTVQVLDSAAASATKALSITIAAALTITTTTLPGGLVSSAYVQTIAATGGTAPLLWSVTTGALPNGLALNAANGTITGTPTALGTFNFTVQVADGVGASSTRTLSIEIAAALQITTTSLPGSTVGRPYNQTLGRSGGIGSGTWHIALGTLPPGLSLNSGTGAITGTPTAAGTFNFTVLALDSVAHNATKAQSITIALVPTVTTTSLPGGTLGTLYSQTLAVTGGTAPLAWSLAAGTLPSGLGLNGVASAITGIPTTVGTANFTVLVTDAVGATATKALTISIASVLTITTPSLSGGTVGTAYSRTVGSSGGTAPLTWLLSAGALPAGLTLNTSTGAITGTPTTAGTSDFTLRVTDSVGAIDTRALSIGMLSAASLVSISKTGSGGGTITTNPAGINCGSTCSTSSFTSGQVVTLTATPAAGAIFSGWSGDADCIDGSVAVSPSTSCTARFDLPQSSSMQVRGDFDGDGKTDVAVYRPPTGEWFIRLSTQGYSAAASAYFQWGLPGDIPIVGDFDGDRKAEIAVYRPSTGEWFMRLSTQGYSAATNGYFLWGAAGDVPVPGDFDGDRKTDIAVYRPSLGQWFIRLSTLGFSSTANAYFPWGAIGDVPVPGDFDGDSKTDIAVYRPSTEEWFIRLSTQGYSAAASSYFLWGGAGNVPVPGDFDGDSKADIAKYRPSTGEWFIRLSTLGYSETIIGYFQWGAPNDRPILGDFDGDGKTEATIFRPSTGEWFIRFSTQGYSTATNGYLQWGVGDDLPLPR